MSEKVYGLHAVRALLTRHAERVTQVTMVEGRADPRMTEIQTLAQKSGKTIKRAAPAVFKQLFGEAVHQGVFVDVLPLAMWREEELIAAIAVAARKRTRQPAVRARARRRPGSSQSWRVFTHGRRMRRARRGHPEGSGRADDCHGAQSRGRGGRNDADRRGHQPRAHAAPAQGGRALDRGGRGGSAETCA